MPWQLKFSLKLPAVPALPGTGLTRRIRQRFAQEAGQVIVLAVRNQIGYDQLYRLKPEYAKSKPKRKGYQRYPGKDADQPLILTGDLLNNLVWRTTGDGLEVQVADGHGIVGGFDVAEYWEEIVEYLEKGFGTVEADLPDLLLDIIFSEMNL